MLADGRAQLLGGLPDDPAGGLDGALVLAEGGRPGDIADAGRAEGGLVIDDEALALDVGDAGEEAEQLAGGRGDTRCGHGVNLRWASRDAGVLSAPDATA